MKREEPCELLTGENFALGVFRPNEARLTYRLKGTDFWATRENSRALLDISADEIVESRLGGEENMKSIGTNSRWLHAFP